MMGWSWAAPETMKDQCKSCHTQKRLCQRCKLLLLLLLLLLKKLLLCEPC
jgi:hypothetical protein